MLPNLRKSVRSAQDVDRDREAPAWSRRVPAMVAGALLLVLLAASMIIVVWIALPDAPAESAPDDELMGVPVRRGLR